MRAIPPVCVGENDMPTADVLDWCGPFAARVMSRIHEYDDSWPKPRYVNTVVRLDTRRSKTKATVGGVSGNQC